MHNQFILEKNINPDIFGIVVEISSVDIWDAYILSNHGKTTVSECSKKKNLANFQHAECGGKELYTSVKERIKELNSPCQFLDYRLFACELCDKKLLRSSLLKHIAHSKKCKAYYGTRLEDMKKIERENSNSNNNQAISLKRKATQSPEDELKAKKKKENDKKRYQNKLMPELQKKYENDLREKLQKKYENDLQEKLQKKYDVELKRKMSQDYKNDPEPKRTYNREKYRGKRKNRKFNEDKFQQEIEHGPSFICISCHSRLFANQVKVVSENMRKNIKKEIWLQSCLELEEIKFDNNFHVCHNCHHVMRNKKKRPRQSIMNGMTVEQIPVELDINCIENQLIAKNVLFAKLIKLPKSRIDGMKDRVVNVPIEDQDVLNTIESFPRNLDEGAIIPVQFKRMKSMKNVHVAAFVKPIILYKAVACLKAKGHPSYQDLLLKCLYCQKQFNINENILHHIEHCDHSQPNSSSSDDLTDVEETEENPCLDAVRQFQAVNEEVTSIVSNFPETDVVVNTTDSPKVVPIKDSTENQTMILAPGNISKFL